MQAQQNFVGWDGSASVDTAKTPYWGGNVNTPFVGLGHAGLLMSNGAVGTDSPAHGTVVAAGVTDAATSVKVIVGASSEEDLWNKFVAGEVSDPATASATQPSATGSSYCGAAVHAFDLKAGESKTVTFVLSWHFPNRMCTASAGKRFPNLPDVLGNHYATRFRDARSVSEALVADQANLIGTTRLYRDTMFDTPIPASILDSAAGRVAVMRCPTMWWTADGIVLGNEGNSCCPLNCSHVYGYTMLLERLFPTLAMDMHYSAFVRNYNAGVTMRYSL